MPDDAVVPLADNELEGALLSRVAAAWTPASRARKLGSAARDEGAEPQDLFVSQLAVGLPAAGRAHARDEISDRNERIITEDIRPHRLGELKSFTSFPALSHASASAIFPLSAAITMDKGTTISFTKCTQLRRCTS